MLLLLEYFITATGNRTKTINRTGLLTPPLNGFLYILRPYNKDFFSAPLYTWHTEHRSFLIQSLPSWSHASDKLLSVCKTCVMPSGQVEGIQLRRGSSVNNLLTAVPSLQGELHQCKDPITANPGVTDFYFFSDLRQSTASLQTSVSRCANHTMLGLGSEEGST